MDAKEQEFIETDSSQDAEYYWSLFSVDLCGIVAKDLLPLFAQQNESDSDNLIFNADEQALMEQQTAQKKEIAVNAKILISNTYGKTFIFYPSYDTLLSFDSIAMTNYATVHSMNETNDIPPRGISLPKKLYRVFNGIKANKMRLSHDEQYIAFCDQLSLNVYHIAQFFNETQPKSIWNITLNADENILEMDWNKNALFLVIDKKSATSGKRQRILKHYALSQPMNTPPKYIGIVPKTPHHIMEIKLWMNDMFAMCSGDGFVTFCQYSPDGKDYDIIHSINISKHHQEECTSLAVPYLITFMMECNEICIHYGIKSEDNKYTPYFCIFRYDDGNVRNMRCILSEHTGFSALSINDMTLSRDGGIKSLYIPHLNYLVFCCKYNLKPAVYGAQRNVLDVADLVVKYDADFGNGNICDVALDFHNEIKCMDLDTEQNTLPAAPILVLLTNKFNFGCFNIIPCDNNYDMSHSLPIMKKAIRSLPPIPAAVNDHKPSRKMSKEILDKYKLLYKKYFTDLYLKYAKESVHKVDKLMTKYSGSYEQLQGLYERLIKKYNVKPSDIQPLISVQNIKQMKLDENGCVITEKPEPCTPIKTNLMCSFDAASAEFAQMNEIRSALNFANDDDDDDDDKIDVIEKKEKAPFSSAVFDENVPNQQVEYEFFNAFKQIQVEMERLRVESNDFNRSMAQTKSILESRASGRIMSIDKCSAKLAQLSRNIKQEQKVRNDLQSKLDESALKEKHHEMYLDAMRLKTKAQKFNDPTYTKALKMRGLDEEQENKLLCISDKIHCAQKHIESWREYNNDEWNHHKNNQHQTANELYKSCVSVESLVADRYNKYLELVSQHAPHLLLQNLAITPRKSNKTTLSCSPIIARDYKSNDALYAKHIDLQKTARYHRNTSSLDSTPKHKWSKLSKYEKRLDHAAKLKPISKYKYKQYITPTSTNSVSAANTNCNSRSQSPLKSPSMNRFNLLRQPQPQSASTRRLSSRLKEKRNTMDFKQFETKIQRTPCKSSKKHKSLKKLINEKNLSRQPSTALNEQKASDLEFKKTPGFGTIKRRDRRKAVRLQAIEPYQAPKKPSNFMHFSPKKETMTETKIESPKKESVKKKVAEIKTIPKPKIKLQATKPITNNIIGLTQTPEPIKSSFEESKKEEKEKEKAATNDMWNWGEQSSKNKQNTTNMFASFNAKNENKAQQVQQPQAAAAQPMDPLSIYQQRITKIYTNVNQAQKLQKVLQKLQANNNNIGWMHSLYVKICNKYNITPEGMVQLNNNNNNNNTRGSFAAATNTGFGSMSNWNSGNNQENKSQTNAFSNFGNSNSKNNNNNNNPADTSWNWSNNNSNNDSFGFASTATSNQPSWINPNLSLLGGNDTNNDNNNTNNNNGANNNGADPFAAFASCGGGFGSLLS